MEEIHGIPPRLTQRMVIVPLPAPRQAWFVDARRPAAEATSYIAQGPVDVVAIAYEEHRASWDARWRSQTVSAGSDRRHTNVLSQSQDQTVPHGSVDHETEWAPIRFLVLPPAPRDFETLFFPPDEVFFSREAAEAAARERTLEAAVRRADHAGAPTPGGAVLTPAEQALFELVQGMALVFDHDWEMTVSQLSISTDPWVIAPQGTFLRPHVADESNNWANRGAVLAAYRHAVQILRARGVDPENLDEPFTPDGPPQGNGEGRRG